MSGAQANPSRLQALSEPVREGYVEAFAASLDAVFLAAVPFAVVAFALSMVPGRGPNQKDRRDLRAR